MFMVPLIVLAEDEAIVRRLPLQLHGVGTRRGRHPPPSYLPGAYVADDAGTHSRHLQRIRLQEQFLACLAPSGHHLCA